jgi:hypothetical protein
MTTAMAIALKPSEITCSGYLNLLVPAEAIKRAVQHPDHPDCRHSLEDPSGASWAPSGWAW